jgi:hypothetical protein
MRGDAATERRWAGAQRAALSCGIDRTGSKERSVGAGAQSNRATKWFGRLGGSSSAADHRYDKEPADESCKAEMDEEETREALRRFINNWRGLIGANPSQLSLVERIDQPDRTKIARYEQRPFRYPLRGDYGKLEIHFTADRRLLNLSSSSIPDAERLQAVLANITPRLTAEDAIKHVRDNGVEYTDSLGNQQTYKVSANNEVNPSELVIYALSSRSADALEIYIAWEIAVSNAPFKTVYLDALNAKIVAVR